MLKNINDVNKIKVGSLLRGDLIKGETIGNVKVVLVVSLSENSIYGIKLIDKYHKYEIGNKYYYSFDSSYEEWSIILE